MWQLAGLPLHPLLVHAVVVLLPLAALMVVVGSVWPAARRRLGILTPIVAIVGGGFALLAKQAGEALERQVPETALVEAHTEMGNGPVIWAFFLIVVAVGQWAWFWWRARRADRPIGGVRVITAVIAVVAIVVAVGTTIDLVLVGDSGARAVWSALGGA
ncbi:MAG: hypothetical protein BGO45_16450 [Microbacterium sp. 71-36]|uniref:DUF2231 domain-containing protein n=1 Tax=unclassified Microbacterium TaxID=2609290 RepID=UPI00086E83C6|nr:MULTISPECIES: DUF2231 domain-containing protein [unclassified Microbacterium]MBN9212860.1 hypothetical protein [Microbacterium sp.]ODT40278.1 MAG: hypothetical protein ABS60_04690 [Microbacterium sp. SCN 71-17]OJV78245.1 MAG: hypothetical protein BGO45_16450 [Microbacterium sp. 71-36]